VTTSEQIKLFCVGLSVMFKERPSESSPQSERPCEIGVLEADSVAAETVPPAEVPETAKPL